MTRSRYKLTGFARLFIFLLFFAPIAYIGASYYHGEDGLAKIKELFNKEKKEAPKESPQVIDKDRFGIEYLTDPSSVDQYEDEIKLRDLEIKMLKEKVDRLERELKQKEKFIQAHQH